MGICRDTGRTTTERSGDEDDGGFEDDLDDVLGLLRATPPVDPDLPVLVPGDPETAAREERRRDGIPLSAVVVEQVRDICGRAGTSFLLGAGS